MSEASIFIQWKNTDVCLDFNCACGQRGHFDGDFAYGLRCGHCGRVWEMPTVLTLQEGEPDIVQEVLMGEQSEDQRAALVQFGEWKQVYIP